MNRARILIVDDSLTVRMDLADAFTAAGFHALPCGNLVEARAMLDEHRIGLIILDVVLPDGNGVDFLRTLREQPQNVEIPVLMLSSEAEIKDRIRGLQTGATEYVGKPYDRGYVIARARELLRSDDAPEQSTVLLIDDSATYRAEMRSILEEAGYRVLTAVTGEEGLQLAAASDVSAILVDGMLPGIDGATVIRKLRLDAALRNIPCILLTAADDYESELRALDAGADAFVRKSDHMDLILARLGAVLRLAVGGATKKTASLLAPKKILAIDDSPTFLNEVCEVLRAEGYDMIPARSGEEALELLAVQSVDCILLDLLMPGLGGGQTCHRIKASPLLRDVPLIILTSIEDRDAMIEVLTLGADDFIRKSSDFEVLKARVRAQLRRKQFEDEHRLIREELLRGELDAAEARAARELAETRAALVEELERKNEELEAFSYSVSHDLRAPLRAIDGYVQILMESATQLDEQDQRYLRQMQASTRRMAELIDDLLELAQVGRMELQRESLDLSALAAEVIDALRERDPDRVVQCAIAPKLRIDADRRLMHIVLENLLGNAWKFTRNNPAARIQVGSETRRGMRLFYIRDNGAGFDMDYAEKLFRPFQRLHLSSDFPGTGIGLATVKRIMDRHGGRIWAEAETGKGACFLFTTQAEAERASRSG